MTKKTFHILLVLSLLSFSALPASAISINLLPSNQEVDLGIMASFDLKISGLGDREAPSLAAFEFDISFDNTLLSFNLATFGDPDPLIGDQLDLFGFGFNPSGASATGGVIDIFEISLDSDWDLIDLQIPEFVLATLSFNTIAAGVSPLEITDFLLIGADPLAEIPPTIDPEVIEGASIRVVSDQPAPVPEPATILLIASGLFGMGVFGRKKLKK